MQCSGLLSQTGASEDVHGSPDDRAVNQAGTLRRSSHAVNGHPAADSLNNKAN